VTNIALAGHRLDLRSPRRLEARAGGDLAIELDIELAEPWLERPRIGREVRTVDGHSPSGLVLDFTSDQPASVPSLITGTAIVADSRIDVHTPAGFPDAGAGRGYEVTVVAPGGFTVSYGHLARGSGRTGLVRAGDAIGSTGNTGHCVDSCHATFVHVEVAGVRHARSLDELFAPIEVELLVDGRSRGATSIPAGETRLSAFRAGRVSIPRDQGRGTCVLEVRLQRRCSVIASFKDEIRIHV
jgi:hypothetical protein